MTKNLFQSPETEVFVSDTNTENATEHPSRHQAPSEGLPKSDKELKERWREVRSRTLDRLYKNDPHIREGINAQLQIEKTREKKTDSSNVVEYDEAGRLLPPKKSLLAGGTTKEAVEYMTAIRKRYETAS